MCVAEEGDNSEEASEPKGDAKGWRNLRKTKWRLAKGDEQVRTQSDGRKHGYILMTHDGPIGHRKRGFTLTVHRSDTGSAGIFSPRTNRTQEARVYSHHGPIGHRKRGSILTTDQSDT
eukprot:7904879-Pyramimonas_sp.AAC.1